MSDPSATTNGDWDPEDEPPAPVPAMSEQADEGCDCTELCSMGPTCPGGMLAGLPGAGCWRTASRAAVLAEEYASTQICYRTTTPTAFHSALRDAFLAGYEASAAARERT